MAYKTVKTTPEDWQYVYDAFKKAGFGDIFATKAADDNIRPRSKLGKNLIRHRQIWIELYKEEGYTRTQAIELCDDALRAWNLKQGEEENHIYSEVYAA